MRCLCFKCYSNKHGLWIGETVAVPSVVTSETRSADSSCGPKQWPSAAWESVHADLLRQQAAHFDSESVFTEVDGKKHTPYITLEGVKGKVFVGVEGGEPIHPMVASRDGAVHWVTEIYIVDQDGNIVAMESLDPTDVSEATMEFDITEDMTGGGTTLKAYSYCNIHGLWVGPEVEVVETDEEETGEVETDEVETDEVETDEVETDEVETDEVSPAEEVDGDSAASTTSSGDLIGAALSAAAVVAML